MYCAYVLVGAAKPGRTGSLEGGTDVDIMRQQLEKLDAEVKEVTAKVDTAYAELVKVSAIDGLRIQVDILQMRYDDLKSKKAKLDERRKALEAVLCSAGGCCMHLCYLVHHVCHHTWWLRYTRVSQRSASWTLNVITHSRAHSPTKPVWPPAPHAYHTHHTLLHLTHITHIIPWHQQWVLAPGCLHCGVRWCAH